jgi:hypothetical protein
MNGVRGRREDGPDEPAPEVRVERISGVPRRVFVAAGVVVVLIVVALVKPWGGTPTHIAVAPATVTPPASRNGPPTPRVTPSPDRGAAAAAAGALCISPSLWRLVTMETNELGNTRSLYSTTAVEASGPADASIPVAPVAGNELLAIGVCRPLSAVQKKSSKAAAIEVRIWAVDPGGGVREQTTSVVDPDLYAVGEAYYAPGSGAAAPGTSSANSAGWTTGRYSIEIDNAAPDGSPLWLGLDFSRQAATTGAAAVE